METKTTQTKVFGEQPSTPSEQVNTQETFKAPIPQPSQEETKTTTKVFGEVQDETAPQQAKTNESETHPKQETTPEVAEEVKQEEKPTTQTNTEEESKQPIKVSFGEETEQATKPQEETTKETLPLTADQVLQFLKQENPNFKDLENLADLSRKESLPESVAKFKKFVEETGRENISDFYNVNKDWSKETPENRIREYLKFTEPNISDEAIQTQLELVNIDEEEMEYLSDREQKQRKLDFERLNQNALSYLQNKAKEYATPLDSKQVATKPPTEAEIAQAYAPYWESRDKSLKELNEVSFKVDGIGEIKVPIDENLKRMIAENTQTQDAFFKRWQNDKGVIDTKKSNTDTLWGIDEIREKHLIPQILDQFQVLLLEAESKKRRNVQLDPVKKKQQEFNNARVVKHGTSQADNHFGKPLI